jgi:hypothetical protein
MKKFLITLLLLQSSFVLAAKDKVAPNPANYPLTIHVACSFLRQEYNGTYASAVAHIGVTLNGKLLDLLTRDSSLPFVLGDYKARLVKDTSPDSYEVQQTYELLLPDGKLRTFAVNGIGQAVCAIPTQ